MASKANASKTVKVQAPIKVKRGFWDRCTHAAANTEKSVGQKLDADADYHFRLLDGAPKDLAKKCRKERFAEIDKEHENRAETFKALGITSEYQNARSMRLADEAIQMERQAELLRLQAERKMDEAKRASSSQNIEVPVMQPEVVPAN